VHKLDRIQPLYIFAFNRSLDGLISRRPSFQTMTLLFAREVLPQAGMPLDTIRVRGELSNASHRAHVSSYTACVYDIGLGNIDLCLGDFWGTPDRYALGVASFVQIDDEAIRLVVPLRNNEESFWDLAVKPFRQFSLHLWGMLAGIIIVVSFAMIIFEYGQSEGDFENSGVATDMLNSMYLAMSSMYSGICFKPVTVSGRLVALGYGTFIVIVFASFTAETASYVIMKQMEKTIDSLEAALRNGNSICFSTGMSLMAETKYDRFAKLGVEIDSFYFSEYASAMDTGLCDFALVANRLLTDECERGESCNFKIVGGPVLSFPVGY